MKEKNDIIRIKLPKKAEYVSIARLVSSGAASRTGFDIDTVEDIKVAVSEVCTLIVSKGRNENEFFEIEFIIKNNEIIIRFICTSCANDCLFDENDQFAKAIIEALMDGIELCHDEKGILEITKKI